MSFAPPQSTFRILLVDDQENDTILIQQALASAKLTIQSLRVETADQIRTALHRQAWDIVLCDHAMPTLQLRDVMDIVAEDAPGTPIIVVSGTIGEEVVTDVMRMGVADVILKDRLFARLPPAVMREVRRARTMQTAQTQRRRLEAILAFFNEAPHWHAALDSSLRYLSHSFGADLGVVCEIDSSDGMFRSIADWAQDRFTALAARVRGFYLPATETLIGRATLRGEALLIPHIDDVLRESPVVLAEAARSGITAAVCQPIRAGGRRFSITLAFAELPADLSQIADDLAAVSDTLQPTLFRKISETERALLSNALEAALSGVLITDAAPLDPPGPRIVYANEAICRMSGYKRHELLGRTPRILQGAQTNLETLSEIRTALERSAPVNVELANHRRDGMPFWIELNITPVYDQGRVTHFIAIQTDITARRTAEAERHRQDASFRLLFESNPMPMWVYDVETLRFLEVNSAAIERYGFSREEFLARNLLDVQLPERRAAVRMTTHDPVATQDLFGTNATIPWVHQIASGETIRVRLGVHAIEYQGRAANLSVIWDVTEIERARDELRRKNQELASLTETLGARTEELINASRLAGIGTWSMDFTPMRLTWSPEIYMMAGRDPASFVLDAASILSCVHPEDRDMFTQIYRRLRRAGGYDRAEYRIVRPSGEIRMVREMIRARTDAQGLRIGLAGVVQDITEQKLAEDALLRSEKLKTLGQITGGIAHDFNNLLTVIGLNLETALIDDSLPSDLRSLLEPALRATERGSELTGQMLTYARRPSLRPKAVDLWQLVDSLRPLLARAVGARNQLHVIPPDRPVTVRIDPGQFENALLNLVINAQDAMTESGRVTISVSVESVQHTLHRVPDVIPAGNHALVTVTDTGQGIPAEVLPRIVEPFFTTKAIGKGSGLGLSMVYGFIHQSGGAFSVSSPPGCGTTMELYFPLTDHVDPPAVPAVPDNAPMRRSGLAVLVEDREDLRQTMHRVLEQLGFTTLSVADGEAALDILRNHAHAALLVSGMALPGGGTGAELAAAAKAIHPGLDVVLTSGDKRAAETTPTKWHLLSKPFRLSDMAEMLGRLDRERSKTTQPGSHHT